MGGCRCQALAPAGDAALTDPVCDKSPEPQRIVELAAAEAAAEAPDFRYRRIGVAFFVLLAVFTGAVRLADLKAPLTR